MHVGESVLAPLRDRFGLPLELPWEGEISDVEWAIATYNPTRTHDVTLFILDPARRLALIRKPQFAADVWRPPGGGIQPGEEFVLALPRGAARRCARRTRPAGLTCLSSADGNPGGLARAGVGARRRSRGGAHSDDRPQAVLRRQAAELRVQALGPKPWAGGATVRTRG